MELEQNYVRPDNENMISMLWSKYVPYWPLFVILLVLSVAGAWFYLQFKLPVYESSATLLIKDEKRGIEDSKMIESLNPLSSNKIIENEIEVIKSRALVSQVVKELKLYAPTFNAGRWKDSSAYASSPVKVEVQNLDSLVETKKIFFIYDNKNQTVIINQKTFTLNSWHETPWGKLKFLKNNQSATNNSKTYFSLINPKRVIQDIIGRFEITSQGKLSSVVNLKIRDEVPKRSEDILNTLIQVYDKAAVTDKNTLAANTLTFLDERLKFVISDLDSIEKKLQRYRASKGAINISSQGQLFLENVSSNDQKLSDVNMKLTVLSQIEQYVSSKNNNGGLVPSTLGVEDPLLTNLLSRLYDAELQFEKLKRTAGENNPEVSSLADQIDKIKPSILENIRSQQQSLSASKRNLFSTNSSYTSLLQALPQQERDLVEISREQNIKSSIYSFLLQKREETALSYSSTVSDSRIVDKAESSIDAVGQGNKIIYIISAILALLLGVSLITAKEMFNKTILFRHEVESLSSFPVIGEIVLEKSKSAIVVGDGKSNFIAEEFRMLRTSLHYLGIGTHGKKILITSTISGEGKSFVAANLAVSIAMSGKKVVLVEFDLKNPTLAYKFGLIVKLGLSDYLLGNAGVKEIVTEITNNANLSIITAGSLPDNPSELILHPRTAELLRYLEMNYDYILIDSAPVGLLSDGYVLSRQCDATLYVVRHNYTPKKMLQRLEHNNQINELKNIAIVFNGVRSRGFGKNGYGYGYGYGYIYSQAQNNKKVNSRIKNY